MRPVIGRQLVGDSANQAWGVMDLLAVTDFPDIRYKVAVQSQQGNLLVIPREGGYLVRLHVEMDKLGEQKRVSSRHIGIEQLIAAARRILHPYTLDVKEVPWWSVYEIGQGMNFSMQDSFNLGWKLAAVLRRQCAPEPLHSYSAERQPAAAKAWTRRSSRNTSNGTAASPPAWARTTSLP